MSRSKRAKLRRRTRQAANTKPRQVSAPQAAASAAQPEASVAATSSALSQVDPPPSQAAVANVAPVPSESANPLTANGDLPEEMYAAYELRQRGAKIAEIAAHLGKTRRTIFRWLRAVDDETAERFCASQPVTHVMELAETFADLERTARRNLYNAEDDRHKCLYAEQALRAAKARCDLLAKAGLLKVEYQ